MTERRYDYEGCIQTQRSNIQYCNEKLEQDSELRLRQIDRDALIRDKISAYELYVKALEDLIEFESTKRLKRESLFIELLKD